MNREGFLPANDGEVRKGEIALVKWINLRNGRPTRMRDGSYGPVWTREGPAKLGFFEQCLKDCGYRMIWIKATIEKRRGSWDIIRIERILHDFPWKAEDAGLSDTIIATAKFVWRWPDDAHSTTGDISIFCDVGLLEFPIRSIGCDEIQIILVPRSGQVKKMEEFKLRAWRWKGGPLADGKTEGIETPSSLATTGESLTDTWFEKKRDRATAKSRNNFHQEATSGLARPNQRMPLMWNEQPEARNTYQDERRNYDSRNRYHAYDVRPYSSSSARFPSDNTWIDPRNIQNMLHGANNANNFEEGTSAGWRRENNYSHPDSYDHHQEESKQEDVQRRLEQESVPPYEIRQHFTRYNPRVNVDNCQHLTHYNPRVNVDNRRSQINEDLIFHQGQERESSPKLLAIEHGVVKSNQIQPIEERPTNPLSNDQRVINTGVELQQRQIEGNDALPVFAQEIIDLALIFFFFMCFHWDFFLRILY